MGGVGGGGWRGVGVQELLGPWDLWYVRRPVAYDVIISPKGPCAQIDILWP